MERWLRQTINGDAGARLTNTNTIVNRLGEMLGNVGAGGVIAGKNGTDGIARWAPYPGVSFETVTHHLLKQMIITHIMLKIEEDHENPRELRADKLLSCALTHDLSEIIGTDVNYHQKNKNANTRVHHKRRDSLAHAQVISGLRPEWRSYIPAPPDINDEYPEIEKLFWNCAELVGYCLFMLEEVRLGNIGNQHMVSFHDDVQKYITRLEEKSKAFASVREFLDVEILPKWQRLAAKVEKARDKLKK
ncbi:MAG: YfbR-like 5'-deoxynucleotidase [Patescibacteria group bacterium]